MCCQIEEVFLLVFCLFARVVLSCKALSSLGCRTLAWIEKQQFKKQEQNTTFSHTYHIEEGTKLNSYILLHLH